MRFSDSQLYGRDALFNGALSSAFRYTHPLIHTMARCLTLAARDVLDNELRLAWRRDRHGGSGMLALD